MNTLLCFALKLAKLAGKEILKNFQKHHDIEYKSVKNPVTEIDKKIEKLIAEEIKRAYPKHLILSEELHSRLVKKHKFLWIVDPIDGTVNFIHKLPFVAVSIGLEIEGELSLGVVYNPILNELFTAVRAKGAFLNGKKINVSHTARLSAALLATGMQPVFYEKEIKYYKKFCKSAGAVRRCGCASLDLCYLACGKFDGVFETELKPWDIAAGIVILKEAGGKITNFAGGKLDYLRDGNIIASNKRIHSQMLKTAHSASRGKNVKEAFITK